MTVEVQKLLGVKRVRAFVIVGDMIGAGLIAALGRSMEKRFS